MTTKTILLLFAACLGIAACNQQDQKVAQTSSSAAPKKAILSEPFKYHKMIEVAPGNYYDVLSWGRGAAGGGAYMILRSDSANQEYNTVNGDLDGPIQDVLNTDMDVDGNPEIFIQANTIDTNRYTNVFAYEYRGDNAQKLDFPRLTASQRKGYRGNDNFYIKDSKLMREFPVFEGSGVAAKPTGVKRLLEYSFHSNSFSVKQVSKDSTSTRSEQSDNSTAVPAKVNPKDGVTNNTPKVTKRERHTEKRSTRHKMAEKHRKAKPESKKKKRHRRG